MARSASDVERFIDSIACVIENYPPASVEEKIDNDLDFGEEFDLREDRLRIVLTIREDFLHWLERYRKQIPSLMQNRFELLPFTSRQGLKAVRGPARIRRKNAPDLPSIVDDDTAEQIVKVVSAKAEDPADACDQATISPPILSLLCERLNAKRIHSNEETINKTQVITADEVKQLLRSFYDSTISNFAEPVRNLVEGKLISNSGQQRESVSWQGAVSKLSAAGVKTPEIELEKLLKKRLLSIDELGSTRKIELIHDILGPVVWESFEERQKKTDQQTAELKRRKAIDELKESRRKRVMLASLVGLLGILLVGTILEQTSGIRQSSSKKIRRSYSKTASRSNSLPLRKKTY